MSTDLEVFRATVEHRRPARILYGFGCTPDLDRRLKEHVGGQDYGAHYGTFRPCGVGLKRPADRKPIDYSRYWEAQKLPEGTKLDESGVAMAPSGFYHFWGYISPLRNATSISEIEDYPLDDLAAWDASHMPGEVAKAHAAGRVAVGWIGHMYETSWQIRGYEPFLLDMIERPAWAEAMLEKLFRMNLVKAVACAKAGVDMIHCGDDVANQKAMTFSPDLWRTMMLSRWRKVWREFKALHPAGKVWYHSDGNVAAIVGELIEAGVDILNPVQPECLDVDALHRRYGNRLCFDGLIGTQSTMPWGTPQDVRSRVKEIIEKYGRSGGLLVSPTHVLEPEVPIANIEAMCDACREFGTFE
jgi:uroporphyrinogen decarboxylase